MDIVLIGSGGHSKVVQDVLLAGNEHRLYGILDDKYIELIETSGIVTGPLSEALKLYRMNPKLRFHLAIGSNAARARLTETLGLPMEAYLTLVHPTAVVSPRAQLGYGTAVMAMAVIQADAKVGSQVIINTGAIVEHDNRIGDYAHVCPGSVLTGGVQLGEGSMVGAGSSVIPGCTIGAWTTIGAGSAVVRPIPANCTAYGNPALVRSVSHG